jgi:hypothetical protein
MKFLILFSLFLFFSCKTSKDIVSASNSTPSSNQVELNLDYEGKMMPAMQLDKLAEAQLKTVDPSLIFIMETPLSDLDYKEEEIPAIHLEKLPIKGLELIYIPKPDEPASLYKILPYNGEEIPAIHLDNSTFDKIRGTKGMIIVPKVIELK